MYFVKICFVAFFTLCSSVQILFYALHMDSKDSFSKAIILVDKVIPLKRKLMDFIMDMILMADLPLAIGKMPHMFCFNHQFAHPSPKRLINYIKTAGIADTELFKAIESIPQLKNYST